MSGPQQLTPSLEDYLEAIFELGPPTRVSAIARHLGVAKASVTQAVQRLVEKGLVESPRYGRVDLTVKGYKFARKVRGRHDTLVTFLKEILEVSGAVAERDACILEHGLSDETARRLADYTLALAQSRKKRRAGRRKPAAKSA
jgi:DtxR family Mn-dependent transcriptional regulator